MPNSATPALSLLGRNRNNNALGAISWRADRAITVPAWRASRKSWGDSVTRALAMAAVDRPSITTHVFAGSSRIALICPSRLIRLYEQVGADASSCRGFAGFPIAFESYELRVKSKQDL